MSSNELPALPVEVAEIAKNVTPEKRAEVQSILNRIFEGVEKMRTKIDSIKVVDEKDNLAMSLAKTSRLAVRNVRLDAEKEIDLKRDEVQLKMLSSKTEDGLWLKAKQVMQLLTKELEGVAKYKEETLSRFKIEQVALKFQARINEVAKVNVDILHSDFENLSDTAFDLFIKGIELEKKKREDLAKKLEAERVAKEEAEKANRLRIEQENDRLREEAAAQLRIEAERAAKEELEIKNRLAKEAADRKDRDAKQAKINAAHQAELAKERQAREKVESKERAKREALELQLKNKSAAEQKVKDDEAARIEGEAQKGDGAKIKDLIADLEALKTKYAFKSARNKKMYVSFSDLIVKLIIFVSK